VHDKTPERRAEDDMHAQFEPHDSQAEKTRLLTLFERQRAAYAEQPFPGEALRRDRMARLRKMLQQHTDNFCAAIAADFGHRSVHETRAMELMPTLSSLRHAEKHLRRWM